MQVERRFLPNEAASLLKAEFIKNLSGGRVSNAWVTCLTQGDNASKGVLIPHKTTVPHDTEVKGAIRYEVDSRLIR